MIHELIEFIYIKTLPDNKLCMILNHLYSYYMTDEAEKLHDKLDKELHKR